MSDVVDAETLGWEEGIHYPSWVDLLLDALRNADWNANSTASTHGCRHVGITEIKRILSDAFADENHAD